MAWKIPPTYTTNRFPVKPFRTYQTNQVGPGMSWSESWFLTPTTNRRKSIQERWCLNHFCQRRPHPPSFRNKWEKLFTILDSTWSFFGADWRNDFNVFGKTQENGNEIAADFESGTYWVELEENERMMIWRNESPIRVGGSALRKCKILLSYVWDFSGLSQSEFLAALNF